MSYCNMILCAANKYSQGLVSFCDLSHLIAIEMSNYVFGERSLFATW